MTLASRLSITLSADFCVEDLEEALARHGKPEIFNTDQGSQFTSTDFTKVLKTAEIAISMDGKGTWRDECLRRAVPPPDPETPFCVYAASGIVSIWSRRNWAGERCPRLDRPVS